MLPLGQGPVKPGSALWSSRIGRDREMEGDREDRIFCRSSTHVIVQSVIHSQHCATPWTEAHQASLSFTISRSLLKSIESVMTSNHLILCRPLLLLPPIFPCIRVLSNESALHIWWPKYCSFSIYPSNEPSHGCRNLKKKWNVLGEGDWGMMFWRKISCEIPKLFKVLTQQKDTLQRVRVCCQMSYVCTQDYPRMECLKSQRIQEIKEKLSSHHLI